MHTVVRNHLTAAVAATTVGAVVLTLAPLTPLASEPLRPAAIQTANVQLLASPLEAYVQAAANTVGSLGGLVQQSANPSLFPIAQAVLQNQLSYAEAIGSGLVASGVNTVDQLFNELPAATVQAISQFFNGDPLASATTVVDAFRAFLVGTLGPIIGTTTSVATTIAFRAERAFEAALSFAVVGAVAQGLLSPAYSAVLATGQAAQNVVDAVGDGDLLGAVGQTIAAPAVIADGFLNGITVGATHYGGLLSPFSFADLSTGPIGALLFARNEIAAALTPATTVATSTDVADAVVSGPTVTLSTVSAPEKRATQSRAGARALTPLHRAVKDLKNNSSASVAAADTPALKNNSSASVAAADTPALKNNSSASVAAADTPAKAADKPTTHAKKAARQAAKATNGSSQDAGHAQKSTGTGRSK